MSNDFLTLPGPARIGADAVQLVKGAVSLARTVIRVLADDIDGDEAAETVKLSYHGVDYEIDLSARNAAALDGALAPYLEAARRVKPSRRTTPRPSAAAPNPKDVRSWARSEGIQISDRGRVPGDVTRRYQEAHRG